MNYFEKRLEELKQETAKLATQREEAENQREDDLNKLCNRLSEEEISVFKSGNHAVITLPVGYLVINSSVAGLPIETQFELNSYSGYELSPQNNTPSVEDEVLKVKNVLDELARCAFKEKPLIKVNWTWYNYLKEKAER